MITFMGPLIVFFHHDLCMLVVTIIRAITLTLALAVLTLVGGV